MPAPEDVLDPRAEPPADAGVRPVVTLPRSGPPTWVLALFAVAAAAILFVVLETRRTARAPDLATTTDAAPAAPPPLYVPAPPAVVRVETPPQRVATVTVPTRAARIPAPPPQPQIVYVPQPQMASMPEAAPAPPAPGDGSAALVVDATAGSRVEAPAAAGAAAGEAGGGSASSPFAATLGARARAGTLANRSGTVPQGTLIPAVLETAFNSNHPGFARAIVSRDIRGFDGTRVLIPRGSRLIGEYRSDTQQGQSRALITWQRLVRPDGATIAIGSPATDRLGRGGVKAKVDSHFFERFAGAILKSTIDIGLTVAAVRAGRSGVLVALPGTIQGSGVGETLAPKEIRPTLKVPAGRSISVFVSRDLDFGDSRR